MIVHSYPGWVREFCLACTKFADIRVLVAQVKLPHVRPESWAGRIIALGITEAAIEGAQIPLIP